MANLKGERDALADALEKLRLDMAALRSENEEARKMAGQNEILQRQIEGMSLFACLCLPSTVRRPQLT